MEDERRVINRGARRNWILRRIAFRGRQRDLVGFDFITFQMLLQES
jgi:hypothetical protein